MKDLISFEGIDGAGKSTQIKMLADNFKARGKSVIVVREPGGTTLGEKIRALLLENKNGMGIEAELLLFAASRSELIRQVVLPALDNNQVVIMDRFFDSTTAYQGYGRGVDIDTIERINDFATGNLKPEITFLMVLNPEEMLYRKELKDGKNGQLDRMEAAGLEFFHKVSDGYLALAERHADRFYSLNAEDEPEYIHRKILQEFDRRRYADCGFLNLGNIK